MIIFSIKLGLSLSGNDQSYLRSRINSNGGDEIPFGICVMTSRMKNQKDGSAGSVFSLCRPGGIIPEIQMHGTLVQAVRRVCFFF